METNGDKYVWAIQIAKIVFFWPRACPAAILSPYFDYSTDMIGDTFMVPLQEKWIEYKEEP